MGTRGGASPWGLGLQEGDSWTSLGPVGPAADLNTNEGRTNLSFRTLLPRGGSHTGLGTRGPVSWSTAGSAGLGAHLRRTRSFPGGPVQAPTLLSLAAKGHPLAARSPSPSNRRSQGPEGRGGC